MPYSERVSYKLNGIPLGFRTALYRESRERNTSYANLISEKLAAAYRVEFQASGRGKANGPPSDTLLLRLPSAVWEHLRVDADLRGIPFRSAILEVIAYSYGLEPPPVLVEVDPNRRPGAPSIYRNKHGRPRGRKGKS